MDLQQRLQETLGQNYQLERELGGGGMSRVLVATEMSLGRRVVIKVLPPESMLKPIEPIPVDWRRAFLAVLTVGCISLSVTACDQCVEEDIPVVTLPATIDFQDQSTVVEFRGMVTPGNINRADFETIRSFLTGPAAGTGVGAVWTVETQTPAPVAFIAFQLSGPLALGATIPVTLAFDGGGWGVTAAATPAVAASGAGFTATSAQGGFQVLAISPLRLGLDVLTANASGTELRIRGEMAARAVEETFCD